MNWQAAAAVAKVYREAARRRPGMRLIVIGAFLTRIGLHTIGARIALAGANRLFDDTEPRRKAASGLHAQALAAVAGKKVRAGGVTFGDK